MLLLFEFKSHVHVRRSDLLPAIVAGELKGPVGQVLCLALKEENNSSIASCFRFLKIPTRFPFMAGGVRKS